MSPAVAAAMLRDTAVAARDVADGRWERELASWLDGRASRLVNSEHFDTADIAWAPENFERQRRFLLDAIERARGGSDHARPLARWAALIEAHPRDSVQVGRRWMWQPTA